ncbi:MAG: transposase [Gluconacetobacter sp.]
MRSTPESAARTDYDGAERKKGSKRHVAVDMFGHLLALRVTPANRDDRAAIGGERPAEAARAYGSALEVVKLTEDKFGFVLLLRR